MSKKITLSNIYNFIEGNTRFFVKELQPEHIKEQIAYRMLLCNNDCAVNGECIKCGCKYPERVYTSKSCNDERFPDFISKLNWEEYKIKKEI